MTIFEIAGYIGLCFSIGSYLIDKPRYALIGFSISATLWGIHYIGSEALIGGIVALACGIRNVFGAFASDKMMRLALVIFLVFITVFTIITYKVPYDVLPFLAATLACFSIYLRDKPFAFRLTELSVALLWLTYCVLIASLPGIITCATQACMIFGAMFVYDKLHYKLNIPFSRI